MTAENRHAYEGTSLIDKPVLQRFQENFVEANCIYVSCFQPDNGRFTVRCKTETANAYLDENIGEESIREILAAARSGNGDAYIEGKTATEHTRLGALPICVDGKIRLIWIMAAVLSDRLANGVSVPPEVLVTTEDRYVRAVQFLEYMSRSLLAVKVSELIAQDAMLRTVESEEQAKTQLIKSETMTKIVNKLESEEGFDRMADEILKMVCSCLGISRASLIRGNADGRTLDMISEYSAKREWSRKEHFSGIEKSSLPFYDGQVHILSSDMPLPEEYRAFFEENDITAAVFQPIEVNNQPVMCMCFFMIGLERVWSAGDIKFLRDVKRIIQSILVRKITKNSLTSSYTSLEAILENVGCGIYVLDESRRLILYNNDKFRELFAHSIESGSINNLLFSDIPGEVAEGGREVYFSEEDRWMDMHRSEIEWVDGNRVSLCTVYDVTDKKIYQKKIESQASIDYLTGLYNRMRCEQDVAKFIRASELEGTEGALMYIDLDDFKHINDGLGHQYGDVLLKAISRSIRSIPGIRDTCYRMGGDEFIVVIPDRSGGRVEEVIKSVRDVFAKAWYLKGEDYYCTMSMGVAFYPTDARSVEELIRKADMALFAAKGKGKNCVEFYCANDGASAYQRLDLEKNLRKATLDECREFEVYYQPIVDITKDGDPCCGAEALVRWNSAELGFVSPGDFVPLAEYLGLIIPIGEFVLREAALRCRKWNEAGHPEYKVNVNLSVVQLLQNDIVRKIKRVIEETKVNPGNLTLEVTESLAINDIGRMKLILGQIKELGVRVALDDFGTGYSSLNHIRELPVDVIKIDRCFIEHIAEDDFSDAFVKMVSELAATLNLNICTEGVELTDQYKLVKSMRIKYIQGYYFGKPMRAEEFEREYVYEKV